MNESPQDFEFKMSFGLLSPHETHIIHVYMEAIAITRHSDVAAKDVSQWHHDMEMLVALLTVYGGGGFIYDWIRLHGLIKKRGIYPVEAILIFKPYKNSIILLRGNGSTHWDAELYGTGISKLERCSKTFRHPFINVV